MQDDRARVRREIGARIRATRMIYGWEQPHVARALKTSVSTVSRWESGDRQMHYEQIIRFCTGARVTADWLLFGYLDGIERPEARVLRQVAPDLIRLREPVLPAAAPSGAVVRLHEMPATARA